MPKVKRQALAWSYNAPDAASLLSRHRNPGKGIDRNASPTKSIPDMFEAMFLRAVASNDMFAAQAVNPLPLPLVIATVCSGTEAPLIALDFIQEAAFNLFRTHFLTYRHIFSCEIEPFKQAFIRRNHDPPIIFRNVVELGASGASEAMDASGSYQVIPTEKIDILIAGTSCVDFSTLNNKKNQKTKVNAFLKHRFSNEDLVGNGVKIHAAAVKQRFRDAVNEQLGPEGLESMGESMTTFLSTLNFIMNRRPRIVIFENVQTAPWKAMQNFWLPNAGYAAEYVRVDSKDFHVPQDRIRGYLVALDAEEFNHGDEDPDAAQLVHLACQNVLGLKQRASASVLDFLMEDDDPNYLQARDEITHYGSHGIPKDGKRANTNKQIDWDFCQLRHSIYSQRWNLDTIRRFSKATLSHGRIVTIAPPANAWIDYWARETPRIIDLFDNLYQQLLARAGCDMNYKAAMFNISQNLDRMPISIAKLGIAPIITPAGMPTLSNLGRPLLGVECLTLQGIPKNRLRLSGESHRDLRDLAGNAMTATVVGAVILATLMAAGERLVDIQFRQGNGTQTSAMPSYVDFLDRGLKEVHHWDLGDFILDPSSLLKHGHFKVCRCPLVGSHNRATYHCRDCGKMACQLCKANPPHDFELHSYPDRMGNLSDFKVHLQQALPGVFTMTTHESSAGFFHSMKERGIDPLYRVAVQESLKHNVFFFSGIKMSTSSVTVEYRSQHGIARLTLSRLGDVEWYVFPVSSGALDTTPIGARDRRDQPIAKGVVRISTSTVDPEVAEWWVWEAIKHSWLVEVSVKKNDSFVLNHQTMESASYPPSHLETHVRDTICGVWQASPRCGTAADGLYIRRAGQKLVCFKDVDPVGHPINDHYIISRDIELAETNDYRGDEVKLEVIRMSDLGRNVKVSVPGYWQPVHKLACFKTRVYTPRSNADSLHVASCATITGTSPEPASCSNSPALTVLKSHISVANLPISSLCKERWTDRWYSIPASEMDQFCRSIQFTANALEKGHLFKPGSNLSFDAFQGAPVKLCLDCCVEPPQLHWVKGNHHVVPWEDLRSVREYQRKIDAMPQPLMARVSLDTDPVLLVDPFEPPNDTNKPPRLFRLDKSQADPRLEYFHALRVHLAVNPRTLASRAAANLAYGSRLREFSPAILDNIQCSFQIEVGQLVGPNVRFNRFYESIPTTEDDVGLTNIEPERVVLPEFLHTWQASGVKWMLAREIAPAPFVEIESEEHVLEGLNLRIIGRASHSNDGSTFCCRGGIVAHEIGYGKTVVTIALLELRRQFDIGQSILERRKAAARFWESDLSFIHLEATLVIVPEHITTQWESELKKFGMYGKPDQIVTIKRYQDLLKTQLTKLKKAKVIIVAASIFGTSYKSGLDLLMEDRPSGGKSDRELEARYRSALNTMRKVVRRYCELPEVMSDGTKETHAVERAAEVVDELNASYQALCQQWSTVGGRKEANKLQRQSKTKVAGERAKKNTKQAAKPKPMWAATRFLENFSFARIVVDEFSYDNAAITLFLSNSLANAKWLLSGTPRCGNLADIVHQGRLLSVHVARPDSSIPSYLDPITVGPRTSPMAPTEEYRERANHLRSHNFALDRHRVAESFIRHFMRQDKVDLQDFDRTSKVIEVELPTLSRIAYGGVRHDLSVAKGNVVNLPFSLRRSLDIDDNHTYSGDNVATGTNGADVMMAGFAALPMTAETLRSLLGAADLEVLTLKNEVKTAIDKLLWLCHRLPLVSSALKDKYPRHHNMRTLVEDVFTAMADARDSWDTWPTASFGGRDAFNQLMQAICPSSAFGHQRGGLEDWLKWRFTESKSFWPDWYDMSDAYIDDLARPEARDELVELATDVILLNISHPLGRSFATTCDGSWLSAHAEVLGRIMDDRTRVNFIAARQASAAEQARAAAVLDTVPKFTTEQLTKFLKECMAHKEAAFTVDAETRDCMLLEPKQHLQRHCLRRNLRYAESNSAAELTDKLLKYVQGHCIKKDFIDKRGVISPRAAFPIPNQVFDRRGGKTEAVLEELTLTYNYLMNCREAWIQAFRRRRLYDLLPFVQHSQYQGLVEKYCDACLRRPICKSHVPGFVVLACGHWLCEAHRTKIDQAGAQAFCPAAGCGAPCGLSQPSTVKLTEQDVLSCPDIWDPMDEKRCDEGIKAVEIVEHIENTPEDDKVVLFTYIEELAKLVHRKLSDRSIPVLSMIGGTAQTGDLAIMLDDFKCGEAKVIIIDPTAEHAAGSNLTIANHVMFASPILERDPFLRRMHYRQAIGRCLRQGQEKKVVVYTFLTKGTIDEEFFDVKEVHDVLGQQAV